ncbi:unnamed protein product [Brassica oleracea]|uniref:(rape) hypothetical protein n=1 Tax=Brassica napus TaxID=3708 RepID=A0A816QQ80_BRANA|nr:unnamed protein product [Brassica napus]
MASTKVQWIMIQLILKTLAFSWIWMSFANRSIINNWRCNLLSQRTFTKDQ